MAASEELKAFAEAERKVKPLFDHIPRGSWEESSASGLVQLRDNVSDGMISAMVGVSWPEGMSVQEQIKAMFAAAIDYILRPDAEVVEKVKAADVDEDLIAGEVLEFDDDELEIEDGEDG